MFASDLSGSTGWIPAAARARGVGGGSAAGSPSHELLFVAGDDVHQWKYEPDVADTDSDTEDEPTPCATVVCVNVSVTVL